MVIGLLKQRNNKSVFDNFCVHMYYFKIDEPQNYLSQFLKTMDG